MDVTGPSKKKSYWYLYLIFILIVLIGIFVFLIPTYLSTNSGKEFLSKYLSRAMGGTVEIEDAQFSWFEKQSIQGFDFESNDHATSFSFENLTFQEGLFNLISARQTNLPTILKDPVLRVDLSKISSDETSQKHFLAVFLQNIQVKDGFVEMITKQKEHIQFGELFLDLLFHSKKHSSFYARAKTELNGSPGQFEFKGDLSTKADLEPLFKNRQYKAILASLDYELHFFAKNLPTLGLDEFVAIKDPNAKGVIRELLGPLLNLQGSTILKKDTLLLDVNLQSENLNANILTKSYDSYIALARPSRVSFTITPLMFEKIKHTFTPGKYLELTKPGGVQIILDQLQMPIKNGAVSFKNTFYSGRFFSSSLSFLASSLDKPITISSLKVSSTREKEDSKFSVNIEGSANYQGKNPSKINAEFEIDKVFFEKENIEKTMVTNVSLEINKFPLSFIDALFGEKKRLETFLGDSLSAKIQSRATSDRMQYLASIDTPRLKIPSLQVGADDSLYLEHPAKISYQPNESFIKSYLDTPYFNINEIKPFVGEIEALGIPLGTISENILERMILQANLVSKGVQVDSSFLLGNFEFSDLRLNVHAATVKDIKIDIDSSMTYDKLSPKGSALFGRVIETNLKAKLDASNLNNILATSVIGQAKSDRLKLIYDFSMFDHFSRLEFNTPIKFSLLPSPELLDLVLERPNKSISYVPYIPVQGELKLEPIFLNRPIFEDLRFKSDLSLEKIDFVNKQWLREHSLVDLKASVTGDSKKGWFQCELTSEMIAKGGSNGTLSAKLTSNNFTSSDFLKEDLKIHVDCQNVASSFLDSFLDFEHTLTDILGNHFDLKLDIREHDLVFEVQKELNTPSLYLIGEFTVTPNSFEIRKKDFKIDYLLTKEGYAAWEKLLRSDHKADSQIDLVHATLLHLKLSNLYWPLPLQKLPRKGKHFAMQLLSEINYNLQNCQFDLSSHINNIILRSNVDTKVTSIEDLKIDLTKKDVTTPFIFNVTSEVQEKTKEANSPKGSIAAAGTLQSMKAPRGKTTVHTKMNAKLVNFPTLLLDSLFFIQTKAHLAPSILLGDTINADLNTKLEDLSGFIDFEIDSKDSKANFNAFLNDGVVKLSKPIRASIKVTKKLADHVLTNMNISLHEAKNPLELYIQDKGFYFPLAPFDLSKVQIRSAKANLGQITCNNLGSPEDVGGFFKLSLNRSSKIYLWFAPMDFSISNGSMNIDRTEVLFDRAYQIAYWGRINLLRKYVDMTLGLTEQSLRKALGIRGLPPKFVLQIPMEGPIGNVRINKDLATARIAFLIAKTTGITKQSGIWGGVVDMLGDMANDQSSVPPAKPPYPWESELSDLEKARERERTLHIIK